MSMTAVSSLPRHIVRHVPSSLSSSSSSLLVRSAMRGGMTATSGRGVASFSTAGYNPSSYSPVSPSGSGASAPSSSPASSPSSSSSLFSRRVSHPLTVDESHRSVLDLYRKICRLLPQVLKSYELEGEDSYHRGVRNLRYHFEHHRQLTDRHIVEMLRHKAENEIEEALLMYKTKSHIAVLILQEPQLASVARAARELRGKSMGEGEGVQQQGGKGSEGARQLSGQSTSASQSQQPSPFLQDFLAGTV